MSEQEGLLMSVREGADLLGVTERQVYRWMADGHLPGLRRIGGRVFLSRPVLVEWLTRQEPGNGNHRSAGEKSDGV